MFFRQPFPDGLATGAPGFDLAAILEPPWCRKFGDPPPPGVAFTSEVNFKGGRTGLQRRLKLRKRQGRPYAPPSLFDAQ